MAGAQLPPSAVRTPMAGGAQMPIHVAVIFFVFQRQIINSTGGAVKD